MSTGKRPYSSYRWVVHTLVWAAYCSFTLLPVLIKGGTTAKLYHLAHVVILMGTIYANIYWLMPKYLLVEKYKRYFLFAIPLMLLGILLICYSAFMLDYPPEEKFFIKKTLSSIIGYITEFMVLSMYKAAKEWYLKAKRTKQLEYEKVQAELGLLRSQLDAHFLFNTLNNLYLLVLKKSDKAPGAILMLSDLLSYNIYESNKSKVLIKKELDFIKSYIDLQKLRLSDDQVVEYNVSGESEAEVEPLILFNFVENAFKHANDLVIINDVAYYVYINIKLSEDELLLVIVNSYKENKMNIDINKGIGLDNTIKRLDLVYGENYELNISKESNSIFRVMLTLNIKQ